MDENYENANGNGIEVAYFYNQFEGKKGDEPGVEVYSLTQGQVAVLSSSVITKDICSEIIQNEKKVGVLVSKSKNPTMSYLKELQEMGVSHIFTSFEVDETQTQ